MSSCPEYIDSLAIQGCREVGGVTTAVTQVFTYNKSTGVLTATGEFSDGGTETEDGLGNPGTWVEGECPETLYDYEKLVLCDANGDKVLVESWTNTSDPAQVRTTRYTYLATNLAYAGDPADLVDCGGEKLDIQTKQYCDSGETVFGTLVFDVSLGGANPPLLGIVFHKVDGSAHTPVSPVEGACITPMPDRQVDVVVDCAGTTVPTNVIGTSAQEVILGGSTQAIDVRIKEDCKLPVDAQVPNCDGTLDDKPVDSITATYLLNQANKHTEKVYDIVGATIGGTIAYTYTAPFNVSVAYAGVTFTNDTLKYIWTDFGDGYSDVGSNPDHSYNADGSYEIKSYAIMASGNKLLLNAKEVTISSGVITYQSASNPQNITVNYNVTVGCALQDYCDGVLVGSPYNADTTAYTVVGTIDTCEAIILDELEDNADFQTSVETPSVERLDMVDFIDPTSTIHFTRIIERTNGVVTATYDIDNTGAAYTPTGVVLSKEKDQEYKSTCYRALINGAGFVAGDVLEFNVTFDPWNPRAPHYINRVNRSTLGIIFEQSPAGITGTFPVVGTEVIPCEQYVECKKDIIAVEQKFYVTELPSAPTGYTGYDFDIPNDYGTTDATDTYFHVLYLSTAYFYPPAVTNPTTPILIDGNVTAINNFIQASLIADGQSGDEFYIVVNADKTITVWTKNTYTPTGNEFRLGNIGADDYTNKYFPVIPTTHNPVSVQCIGIQEIKEKDSCTGAETYRYVIEDGAGNLVDASTFIVGRDEDNVSVSCPDVVVAPIVEIPGGVLLPTSNTFNTFPANVVSFTVSAQSGSFDISFDGGTTFLTARKGTRTRGQGTIETIDVSQVVVVSNGDIDIIRETI